MIKKKLLWAHPLSLYDRTSGAAISMRLMLEELSKRNIEVKVLGSLFFDTPYGRKTFEESYGINQEVLKEAFQIPNEALSIINVPCVSWNKMDQTNAEQVEFFMMYVALLDEFRPDVLLTYADDVFSLAMRAEAKLRGIPVVCPVLNSGYNQVNFAYTDLIITDSKSTAQLCIKRRINAIPVGVFIDINRIKGTQKYNPEFITVINPNQEKGISIVARLILMAEKELPHIKFLLVQGRGNPADTIAALHSPEDINEHPLSNRNFPNVIAIPNQKDMREIYGKTKVLLAPSLWYESFGMVAVEALINGVPVLASKSGGLPEAVGEGGICIETPRECQSDWFRLPTEEEMRPWMDALKVMLDEEKQKEWRIKATEASKAYNLEDSINRVIELLEPFFAQKAGNNVHYLRNSSLSLT